MALTWSGSASPRQRIRKRSGIEVALSTSVCGTGGWPMPRADCATNDSAMTDTRARSSRACSSEMSITCLEAPLGREHGQRGLEVDARVAGAHRERVRLRGRQAGLEGAVDQQAPDLLEGHLADQVLDVDAAVAERAALLVGLGDLGREGDYALEARLNLATSAIPPPSPLVRESETTDRLASGPCRRCGARDRSEAEAVAGLLVEFRDWIGRDHPSAESLLPAWAA